MYLLFLQTQHYVEDVMNLVNNLGGVVVGNRKGRGVLWLFFFLRFPSQLKELLHCICTLRGQDSAPYLHIWMEWVNWGRHISWFRHIFSSIREKPEKSSVTL